MFLLSFLVYLFAYQSPILRDILIGPYFFIQVLEFTFSELLGCLLSGPHCDSVTIATVALLDLNYHLDFTAGVHICPFLASPHLLTSFLFLVMRYRVACEFITGRQGARTTHLAVCA